MAPKVPGAEAIFGIPEVDQQLSGQLPRGWLGILSGVPGSGIELLAKQFAQAAAPKTPVVYYTTSERDEDVKSALRDFGWRDDLNLVNIADEYYEKVLSRNLEVSQYREKGVSGKEVSEFQMASLEAPPVNFVTRMTYDLAGFDQPFRLVLDSLDFFLEISEREEVISLVRQIRSRAQRVGGVALLTVHPAIHDHQTTGTLEEIADLLLDIEVEREHATLRHFINVRKIRNHPERTGIIPVTITPKGIGTAQ